MHRAMLWIFGIVTGLVAVAVIGVAIFIATFVANRLIAPAKAEVKALTGRELLIGGGANLELSLRPKLVINGSISGP
jgi:NAD/NADP transhydrogenase alpha subunit